MRTDVVKRMLERRLCANLGVITIFKQGCYRKDKVRKHGNKDSRSYYYQETQTDKGEEPQETKISAFVNIAPKAPTVNATYYNVSRAMSDEDTRKQVLRNALFELMAFERKYKNFTEFAEVFEAIGKVVIE